MVHLVTAKEQTKEQTTEQTTDDASARERGDTQSLKKRASLKKTSLIKLETR